MNNRRKKIELDTRVYRKTHGGSEPRGQGPWTFRMAWLDYSGLEMKAELIQRPGRHTLVRRELVKEFKHKVPLAYSVVIQTMP